MNIGQAVDALNLGHKVVREGWNGKNMWLELQTPDEHSKMTLPYVYMYTATGDKVPWLFSQTDLLATDWEVISYVNPAILISPPSMTNVEEDDGPPW